MRTGGGLPIPPGFMIATKGRDWKGAVVLVVVLVAPPRILEHPGAAFTAALIGAAVRDVLNEVLNGELTLQILSFTMYQC